MSKVLKVVIPLTATLLLGITVIGGRQFCRAQAIQGVLRASFAGVTNETGEILVILTNCSRWQITYHPRVEVKESGLWPEFPTGPADKIAKPRVLLPFTNEPVALVPPAGAAKWRLWIIYSAATERNKRVQQAQSFFEDIGLQNIGYRIQWDQLGFLTLPEAKDPFDRASD
jgi:hypothetical protein